MPALPSPLLSFAFLAVFLTGAALGYQWRDKSAKLAESQQAQRYTAVLNEALDKARRQEQSLYAQMEALTRDAEKQLQDLAATERAAFDSRLRELAQQYANNPARANPTPTPSCEAERTRAAVLADLLAEADELAQGFARQADANRLAGKANPQPLSNTPKLPRMNRGFSGGYWACMAVAYLLH